MGKTQALRPAVGRLADALLAATLAPRCAACNTPLDAPTRGCVCSACWQTVFRVGSVRWSSEAIVAARAGGPFDGALRDIIHAFKYDGRRSLALPLAALVRDAAPELLADADCVVPVPLHTWRHLRRGFNQADELAKHLGRPLVRALWRRHATPSQSGLTAAARRRNVRGAFSLSPLLSRAAVQRSLRDRVVVLVDDVRTTGETLNACADVLRAAGVREVRAVTAAARDLDSPGAHARATRV